MTETDNKTEQKVPAVAPKNHMRKGTILFNLLMSLFGIAGGYTLTKDFTEKKPLYDTFALKESVDNVVKKQDEQIKAFETMSASFVMLKSSIDERRAASNILNERFENSIRQNTIDIANLKFIVTGKTN